MRRLLLLVLAALLISGGAPTTGADVPRVFPYETHVETLDNGLKVILVPMRSGGLVAYWSVVRTGSRDEYEPGHSGFAHFFEHMMFRGTERFPADVYNDLVTRMGADANAYTTDDLTAYHLGISAEDLATVVELESDRFMNLSYSEEVFRTEAGAVYGEYRKNRTNPFFSIWEASRETAFTRHTYGHTTMGYEADIKRMPEMFDYSRSFFARYYTPDNVVLLIAGDVEVQPTMELIRKHYGGWQAGYEPPKIPSEPEQTEARSVDVSYEGQSLPILWLAYKSDRFDPQDKLYVAASLLAELAFGETSEIHKKLVLKEQAVEFIAADLERNRDPGTLDIYTRVKHPARIDEVLAEIDGVIERYREQLPDAERLSDLKSRLKYGFLMGLDTPDRVCSRLARTVAITGGIEAIDLLYATYDEITPEDIREAARKYLVPQKRTVATLKGKGS